jgi:16S rRNA (adenine1518-N6/adenine1519-N6)-dimethyltransferase
MTTHPKMILAGYSLEPKKSLGQNFLFDENILGHIVEAANLGPQDQVLEIGPGLGSLTRHLATIAQRVVAVELDGRFLPILQNELADLDNVQIVQGDILDQELAHLVTGPYKVVSNVPYYITGAILRHLLSGGHKPSSMILTVQKEVAERLTAEPPAMSLLALSVLYYGDIERVTTIKAGAFWPRPDVDSAVIRIEVRPQKSINKEAEQAFFKIVRTGFSQKRKQLQKNLRQLGVGRTEISAALEEAAIDGSRRAETLTLDEWFALVEALVYSPGAQPAD